MSIVREVNNEIVKRDLENIFEYKSSNPIVQSVIERGFVFSECLKQKSSVLFIGMNPSFSKETEKKSYSYDVKKAVMDYPKHYKNFNELINSTNYKNDWTYLDLLYFRETNQKNLKEFFETDIDFIVKQLRLTYEIIININPDIIIVANSGATNFFGINKYKKNDSLTNIWYGFDFEFKDGFHILKQKCSNTIINDFDSTKLNNKHFIFTSTLKYMNKFDKERLSWLIDLFYKKSH